jgi:hypothetical protein
VVPSLPFERIKVDNKKKVREKRKREEKREKREKREERRYVLQKTTIPHLYRKDHSHCNSRPYYPLFK